VRVRCARTVSGVRVTRICRCWCLSSTASCCPPCRRHRQSCDCLYLKGCYSTDYNTAASGHQQQIRQPTGSVLVTSDDADRCLFHQQQRIITNTGINYVRQVNGVKLADIIFSVLSVHPSVRPSVRTQSLWFEWAQ